MNLNSIVFVSCLFSIAVAIGYSQDRLQIPKEIAIADLQNSFPMSSGYDGISEKNSDELTETEACARISAFSNQSSSAEFPCYFTKNASDFNDVLSEVGSDDSVFVMFGYDTDLSTTTNIEKFGLIFVVREAESQAFRYFDFTQPCPAYCPNVVDNSCSTPPTIEDLGGNKGYWFKKGDISAPLNNDFVAFSLDPSDWSGDMTIQGCDDEATQCDTGWEISPCSGTACPEVCD